ncbi:MAG: AAA family ATPase [Bacteroidales bacterium]|nr:AAA family ATPase [Bacteroidales bacterium]MCM1147755.1 AAA family ATPase [Bacteroidales bacterium]MCM1206635.1 AAA family ATPase [Bacillota bacterium]MCM1510624.1 AAA family ATPase [Clostridium sp.]
MENKKITLLPCQSNALSQLLKFVNSDNRVFILKGYAGTGKTTLVKELLSKLATEDCNCLLLASTGRAAKILSNATGCPTRTVHGLVYKYSDFNQNIENVVHEREKANVDKTGQLLLVFEPLQITSEEKNIYIVDEASMISDAESKTAAQAIFGSGRILNDLLQYDKNGKYIFIGDACQLPPVNQKFSPALTSQYFDMTFGIDAETIELTEIVRQAKGNDIVIASQKLRRLYFNPQPWKWAKFPLKGCRNIHLVNNASELMQLYINDIKERGYNISTMITFSNRQCDTATKLIRPSLGITQPTIAVNDLLLVTQNNSISGLMNGDLVQITDIGKEVHRA